MRVDLYRLPVESPDDVSPLAELIRQKRIRADQVASVIAQNEGDYYARGFTLYKLEELLAESTGRTRAEITRQVPLLMIGLAHVAPLCPHLNVFVVDREARATGTEKRLAVGVRVTRDLRPEEVGTMAHVQEVAETVRTAMTEARLEPGDVHCVYVKVPELTPARIEDATARGHAVRSTDLRAAGAFSRGATALGVALALGEVEAKQLSDEAICRDWSLYSQVAHVSSGIEQTACKVLVIGNARGSASELVVGHGVMADALDMDGFKNALRSVGLAFACCPDQQQVARVENIFIKTGANALPTIRGRRHTMHTDFLWAFSGAQAKAMADAMVASVMGDTMWLAASGCEHQGPRGSNLITVFARP